MAGNNIDERMHLHKMQCELQNELSDSCYIGDAVYINYDGYHYCLKTSNGIEITNRVLLNPDVLNNFLTIVQKNEKHLRQAILNETQKTS